MINCGNIPCKLNANNDWTPNSDIVGYGVIAAFVATAIMVFLAIMLGYCTDSLPDDYYNDADKAVIQALHDSQFIRVTVAPYTACRRLRRWLGSRLGATPAAQHNEPMSKKQRQDALKAFILNLSDQQLVTGIAILIAGFSNACRLSMLEFEIVMSLAWFSSFTHLATLDILRDYLRENKTVRNWRVIGMLSILCLLITAFAMFFEESPVAQSLACTLNKGVRLNFSSLDFSEIVSTLATILIMVYLAVKYVSRIINLFAEPGSGNKGITEYLFQVQLMLTDLTPSERFSILREAGELKNQHVQIASNRVAKHTLMSRFLFTQRESFRKYSSSFLCRIGALYFSFSFGIARIVRWITLVSIWLPSGESTFDFGQIVPLILLSQPLLAAAEAIYSKVYSQEHMSPAASTVPKNARAARVLSLFAVHALFAAFTGIALNPLSTYNQSMAASIMAILGSFLFICSSLVLVVTSVQKLIGMQKYIKMARENHEHQRATELRNLQNIVIHQKAGAQTPSASAQTFSTISASP